MYIKNKATFKYWVQLFNTIEKYYIVIIDGK